MYNDMKEKANLIKNEFMLIF